MKLSKPEASGGWANWVPTPKKTLAVLFGFLGGVARSVIHAGGLVMSPYFIQKIRGKRAFLGTFVLFFAIMNLLKVIAYLRIEILTSEIVLFAAIISPLIILGGFWGNGLNKRVSHKTFRAGVLAVILTIGINLLIKM